MPFAARVLRIDAGTKRVMALAGLGLSGFRGDAGPGPRRSSTARTASPSLREATVTSRILETAAYGS